MNAIMIDPPEGWKYGFPKAYDPDTNVPILEWLVHEGYPQQIIDSYGDHFYTRKWEAGEDERG